MYEHKIIVVGASAGGVDALSQIVRLLPSSFSAAVFVVLHVSAQAPSILPTILRRAGALDAYHPQDGDSIKSGRIFVAPPDHHLLVEEDRVRVIRGPKENLYRPAIDPLFRSAALAYGPRTIGVVLTGALDDGTAGLFAVKERGGIAIVQDPLDALYPSMPRSAIENVEVDHIVPLARIPELLMRLTNEPVEVQNTLLASSSSGGDIATENKIAKQNLGTDELLGSVEELGEVSSFTCPECHGTLWEIRNGRLVRYRCHVGHAFSAQSLISEQSEQLEAALWSALRAMEEKVTLTQRMAVRSRERHQERAARSFEDRAREGERHVSVLRNLLLTTREQDPELIEETPGPDSVSMGPEESGRLHS